MRDTIVFVCTGNICRSPMAAALLQHAFEKMPDLFKNIRIESAGVAAYEGDPQSSHSITALKKVGIQYEHQSQPLTQELVDRALAIICMTKNHEIAVKDHFHPLPKEVFCLRQFMENINENNIDITDPYGMGLNEYEDCRDLMIEAIPSLLKYLTTHVISSHD